ncbi:MAG: hypothetical protein WHV67_07990, partial [Thermoanaerobaculia bacterium]
YLFSTRGGLFLFNKKGIKEFDEREGLLSKNIFVTHEDKKGNFWIGCEDAVYRYKAGKYFLFEKTEDSYAFSFFVLVLPPFRQSNP